MDTMTQPEDTAGIGHNQPTQYEVTKARVDALVEAANQWVTTVPEITTEDQAGRASDFKNQIVAELRKIDAERTAATKPLRDEVAEINDRFNGLKPYLDKGIKRIRGLLTPWMDKLEAEQKAREQAAREEAERLRREAEEKAAAARANIEDAIQNEVAAEEAQKAAKAAEKKATSIARSKVGVKGEYSAKATTTRGTWKAHITDIDKAFAHYKDHPKVAELLTSLGSADARGGRRRIPGFDIKEDRKVV